MKIKLNQIFSTELNSNFVNWEELTKKQLAEWGAKYHELRVDKPFYDLFIEDKALRIEEL